MTIDDQHNPLDPMCCEHDKLELVDYQEHWDTSAVTALPEGWVNVFNPRQLDEPLRCSPAPAVLTQTLVCEVSVYRDEATQEFSVDVQRGQRTRVVAAHMAGGQLIPAQEHDPDYADTVPVERYSDMYDARQRMQKRYFPNTVCHNNNGDGAA